MKISRMNSYAACCDACLGDLYRMAFLCFGNADVATKLLRQVCVAGARTYHRHQNIRTAKIFLISSLFQECQNHLSSAEVNEVNLPPVLRGISGQMRLLLALRFASGLTTAEAQKASGMSKREFFSALEQAAFSIDCNKAGK